MITLTQRIRKICSVDGCNKPLHARSYCNAHYRRYLTHGDPTVTKRPGLEMSPRQILDMHTDKSGECWIYTVDTNRRYGRVGSDSAHRVAYEVSHGPIPDGMVVRHKCDVTRCVRPDHLELGTHADNSKDMTSRKRQAYGERQGSAILTEADVLEIRRLSKENTIPESEIAKQYGVTKEAINAIALGRKWKHLPGARKPRIGRIPQDQIQTIIERIDSGETHQSIASDYGVSRAAISHLNRRRKKAA